jgi:uncharacterized protein (TIGR00297 family)
VPLWLAALISIAVAGAAWAARTLTRAGAFAAWTIGMLVLYGSGWHGGAVLAAFFVSSNLVSRLSNHDAPSLLDPKGDRRDLWQVYANGGPAAIGALAGRSDPSLGVWLVTASLAAAAADTWASALGTRAGVSPRLLGFGAVVPSGTSGGMTLAGTAGACAGAIIVAGAGALTTDLLFLLPWGALIGLAGMTLDSIVGALLQGRFHCPACDQPSEWRIHRCGTETNRTGGVIWLNNDGVNLLTTSLAAAAALAFWHW